MINSVSVGGFQFHIEGITIATVSGGTAENNDFMVSSPAGSGFLLGFSLTGSIISAGEGVLTQVSFSDYGGNTICFGENVCDPACSNVISDQNGNSIDSHWGDCYISSAVSGCTDSSACNYNEDAAEDDGSCEYAAVECWDESLVCNASECSTENAFNPTVSIELSNQLQGFTTDATMIVSQDFGEPSIFSINVQTDGGSFDFSGLEVDDVIGSGNSTYSTESIDYYIDLDIKVLTIFDGSIDVVAIITGTNDTDNIVGGQIGGAYQLTNHEGGGIQVYTENPTWVDGITSLNQTGTLVINNLLKNPFTDNVQFNYEITQEPEGEPYTGIIIISLQVEGCMDATACNYNPDATENDGSCEYVEEYYDCEGNYCDSEVCLYIMNVDTVLNTLDIYMFNNDYVSGFQFELFGITLEDAFPGNFDGLDDFNFQIQTNAQTNIVLGFSIIQGAYIESGTYDLLTQITFTDYNPESQDICFGDDTGQSGANVISNLQGELLNADWGPCICSENNPADECGICGGNGVLDVCGVCEGPGDIYECGCRDISEEACDCDGNEYDCAGVCGGTGVIDECGVCNGSGVPCETLEDIVIDPYQLIETLHSGNTLTQYLSIINNSADTVEINLQIINKSNSFLNQDLTEQDEYAFDNRTDFIYEVGDVISYEDQQIESTVCYGDDYPEVFSLKEYNGAINNGDYHVLYFEIAASW